MENLDLLPLNKVFDYNGFAKVNGTLTCYGFNPKTGVGGEPRLHNLYKGSGLPPELTFVKPPEIEVKGTLIWNGFEWYDDLNYERNKLVAERIAKLESIKVDVRYAQTHTSGLLLKEMFGKIDSKEKYVLDSGRRYNKRLAEFDPFDLDMDFPPPGP